MRTLRSFLNDLKMSNNLKVITDEVSSDLQVSAICGMNQRAGGPAVHFKNISGYGGASLVGSLFSGPGFCYENEYNRKMHAKIAVALGIEPDIHYEELLEELGSRLNSPIGGLEVKGGAIDEVSKEGNDIDLFKYPFPKIHDKDAGRYITSGVVMTEDPETSWTNWAIYRLLVADRDKLVMGTVPHLTRSRDLQVMANKYAKKGEPLPFAIAIGVPPGMFLTAAKFTPPGVDEIGMTGGLMLDPLATVKAELSNIRVPGDAEMVLEGHI